MAEVVALGHKAAALQLNTADTSTFGAFYAQVKHTLHDTFGTDHFDFLLNNAGTVTMVPIADTTEAQFDEMNHIHYKGVFFLTQQALPLLRDGGRIVNISSALTRAAAPGYAAYASAKGAIDVFTRYLAQELGPRRIAANSVSPGGIETDFGGMRSQQVQDYVAGATALGRIGLPDDIGGVVAFLYTPEASWINGQCIEVTGGYGL